MSEPNNGLSRRELIKSVGAATALAGVNIPLVHAAENNTLQVALVGCGGRGTGAAVNALTTNNGPIQLVAMADVFETKMNTSIDGIGKEMEKEKKKREKDGKPYDVEPFNVTPDRRFIGFDGFKKAMDCLKPGDIAILATPPAFRWVQFTYAIEKGINVFMEKPTTVDGPSTRRMLELYEKAKAKNLKVAVGLMCRHCAARGELYDRIKGGQIGDIITMRAYRMQGVIGSAFAEKKPDNLTELLYQIKNFHGFLWASGGAYSDFLIHNIDECCWMKDAWPVEAKASGGRHFRGDYVDQNFDHYSVEYTFGDGSKLMLEGRNIPGAHTEFASYAHGSKGSAVISTASHSPAKCRIYNGQKINSKDDLVWQYGQKEPNPYQLEWEHLIDAIRSDKPYNEAKRGAEASLVTSMGRMAAHTGQVIKYEDILNSDHEFAPDVDKLTMDGPAPLQADERGLYPIPEPGKKRREY